MSETCQICGTEYEYNYRVPDDVWAVIKPRKDDSGEYHAGGLLCLPCADAEARKNGVRLYFDSSVGDFVKANQLRLENDSLRAENDQLKQGRTCTFHDWRMVGGPGLYDTIYRCSQCGAKVTESADAPRPAVMDEDCPEAVKQGRGEPVAWWDGDATTWNPDSFTFEQTPFNTVPLYAATPAPEPSIGKKKLSQMDAEQIGFLAQRPDGRVAAITDMGRVTRISEDVTGRGALPSPAPAAVPAGWKLVPVELVETLQEACRIHQERGVVLTVHMSDLALMLDDLVTPQPGDQ